MDKVIVRKFGGEEVGEITQSPDGQIFIMSYNIDTKEELEAIVKTVTEQPIAIYSGNEIKADQGIIHETIIKECLPGDPDYLRALADALLAPNYRLQGKRIRGIFVRDTQNESL